MEINNRIIWQQACGDGDRIYGEVCIDWGVILNGSAQVGAWTNRHEYSQKLPNWSGRKISDLERFCEQIQDSDLVILRLGTNYAVAVGEIVGRYEYHEQFNDVDGWDIAHVRRVRWLCSDVKNPKEFEIHTFPMGNTTKQLRERDVNNKVGAVYD